MYIYIFVLSLSLSLYIYIYDFIKSMHPSHHPNLKENNISTAPI
jgi:hypothetical protein